MASAFDVAAFIRGEFPSPLSKMKLHKLVYYAQAWSLVWDGVPIFREKIQAWPQGPMVRELWAREQRGIAPPAPVALTPDEVQTALAVVQFYGKFDGDDLSEFTHRESPWLQARAGLPGNAPSTAEITHDMLRAYYGGVTTDGKQIPRAYELALRAVAEMDPEALEELGLEHSDEPADVDVEGHLRWLETGAGDPWPAPQH